MKRTFFARIVYDYSIILTITVVAFAVRWFSNEFDLQFNLILLFTSLILISACWEFLRFFNLVLNKVFPFEKSIPWRITLQLATGGVFALLIRFLIYQFGEPLLPFTLDRLFIAVTWVLYVFVSMGVNTIFFIQFFIGRWKESLLRAERLEKEKAYVQFDNLKNQLNPHFLFNALTSLNSLIFENQALASQFLQHMSKVYRYVLQNKEKNFVSVQTELDFIRNYVFLAETRFGTALKINMEIKPEVVDHAIVPVTLQVLIENALKHNIIDNDKPLTIDVFSEGDYLVVRNNLQKRKTVESSNQQGLENMKSLYRFMTEKPLLIENSDQWFVVKIPLL